MTAIGLEQSCGRTSHQSSVAVTGPQKPVSHICTTVSLIVIVRELGGRRGEKERKGASFQNKAERGEKGKEALESPSGESGGTCVIGDDTVYSTLARALGAALTGRLPSAVCIKRFGSIRR